MTGNGAYKEACRWREIGIATIPILAGSKMPALERWGVYRSRLPREAEIHAWFPGWRASNIAVITGWRRLMVVDFDKMGLYSSWLASLDGERVDAAMGTYRVTTSRGMHLYFFVDEDALATPGRGLDIKAGGGYVLGPPSRHPSGHRYTAIGSPERIQRVPSLDWLDLPLPPEPEWVGAMAPRPAPSLAVQAMQKECGISILETKRRWTVWGLLGIPKPQRSALTICPLHADTHPSLAVYRDGGVYCHGCGFFGDAIDLFAAIHGLTLRGALRAMAAETPATGATRGGGGR